MNILKTGMLLAAMTALFLGVGYMLGGQTGMLLAFALAAGMNILSYWHSDKILLKMYGAQPLTSGAVYDMTAELAQNADLPMPKVYMVRGEQPNAFATGRNPDNAAVAVTEGITRMLTPRELRGVIAHELAHIKNRDTLIMTITATIAGALGMLANFALFTGGNRERGGIVGALAIMILAPLAASLVQMAISRTREYSADRTGAEISGDPLALAAALEKIQHGASRIDYNAAENNPATAHLFIINPLHAHKRDNLFSTHPATTNRVAALKQLAASIMPGKAAAATDSPWDEPTADLDNPWA